MLDILSINALVTGLLFQNVNRWSSKPKEFHNSPFSGLLPNSGSVPLLAIPQRVTYGQEKDQKTETRRKEISEKARKNQNL